MKRIILHIFTTVLLVLPFTAAQSQELDCQVNVSSSQVQAADKEIFTELQKSINEFLNNRKWTNRKFGVEERIECSMAIIIEKEAGPNMYNATLRVQSRRPVFNTSYSTPILNYKDTKFDFEYVKHQNLNFDINSFQSNLTSVLAYYAYLIIGLDFDSFSPLGGTPYLMNAQTIVANAQSSEFKGWKSFEDKNNRYWMVEDLLNRSLKSLREGIYLYHRQGLDQMAEEMEKGRQNVLKALMKFKEASRQKSFLHILDILVNAKKDEVINIFKKAPPMDKPKAVSVLKELDPTNSGDYENILKNN